MFNEMFLFSKFQKDGQSVLSFYIKKVIFDKEEKANCLVTILVKLEDLTVSSRQLLRLDIGVEALLTKVNILSFVGRMVSETAAHLCPLAFLQPQTIWKPMGMAVFQLNMSYVNGHAQLVRGPLFVSPCSRTVVSKRIFLR